MRHWSAVTLACVLGLGGCVSAGDRAEGPDVQEEPVEPRVEELEADFGGSTQLMEFLSTESEANVRALLASYGMAYEVHQVLETIPKNIADCPTTFPSTDRNKWHNFDGEFYYIEGSGRPQRAYKYLPPISAAPRSDSCQTSIGQWGDQANPSNDYDGGHLIGSQLGGWGKRANIVPQDANFNRGNWAQLENAAAKCGGLSSQRLYYRVDVGYPNSSTLIPSSFGLYLEDRTQGDSVTLSFSNTDYGGANGTSQRQAGVSFLQANGCN